MSAAPLMATYMVTVEYQERQTIVVAPQNQWSFSIARMPSRIAVMTSLLLWSPEVEV